MDFKVSDEFICSVGFYNPLCQGAMGNFDGQSQRPEIGNSESLTFKAIGNYTYMIYVGEYLDKTVLEKAQIEDTQAKLTVYIRGMNSGSVAELSVPFKASATS